MSDEERHLFEKIVAERTRTDDSGAVLGDRLRVVIHDIAHDRIHVHPEWMQTAGRGDDPNEPSVSWPWKAGPDGGLLLTVLDAEDLRDALDEALDFASEVHSTIPTRLELERRLQTCVEALRKIDMSSADDGTAAAADWAHWAHNALDSMGDDRGAFDKAELEDLSVLCGECHEPLCELLVEENGNSESVAVTNHDRAQFVHRYYQQTRRS